MGGYEGRSEAGDGGAPLPIAEMRALLDQIADATHRLAASLDAASMNQALRQSSAYSLRSLERGLPNWTVDDLLLACEAYATVTAPSALAAGDLVRVREEALRTLRLLRALAGVRGWRRLTGMTTVGMQGAFLRTAFSAPPVRAALDALMEPIATLAFMDATPHRRRRSLLPVGAGCFVPGTVLASALALIVFLLTSIAFATGQIAISPHGFAVPVLSDEIHHGGATTVSATPTARSSAPKPQPTATPRDAPTASASPTQTTLADSPTLSISKSPVTPCFGAPDTFTLTYSGAQGSVTWTATSSDQTNISLNPSNGTLQPHGAGSSANITVTLVNDVTTQPGTTITITTSNNLTRTVAVDTTGC